MSALLGMAAVILTAALTAPAAAAPGFNSADLICIVSPFAVLAFGARVRFPSRSRGGGRALIPPRHPRP